LLEESLCFRTIKISSTAFIAFVSEPSRDLSQLLFQNHQEIFHSFVSEPSRDLSQLCFRTIKKSSTVSVSETSRDLSQFSFQNHQEIFTACVSKPSRRSFTRLTTSRGLTHNAFGIQICVIKFIHLALAVQK